MADWESIDWKVIDPSNPTGETLAVYKDLKKADAKAKQQEEYPHMAILPVFTEHNKFPERRDEHSAICSFFEFCDDTYGCLEYYDEETDGMRLLKPHDAIAAYFGIDQNKFEAEKRAMLDNPGLEPV